jgi:hypothetical protein
MTVIEFEWGMQHPAVCFEIEIFSLSFMSRDYISLQAPGQISVDRFAQLNGRFLIPWL